MGLLGRASHAPIAAGTHRGAELTSSVKGFLNIGYRPSKKGWMAHSQLNRRPLMARLLDRVKQWKETAEHFLKSMTGREYILSWVVHVRIKPTKTRHEENSLVQSGQAVGGLPANEVLA
jgi:hypothetical protein